MGTKDNGTSFSSCASDSQLEKSALTEDYLLAEASYWSSSCIWWVWSAGWSSLIVSFKGVRTRTKWFHSLFLQATCQEWNLIPTNHNSNSHNNHKKIFTLCWYHMLLLFPKYLRTAASQLFPQVLFSQYHPFCFSWQNLRVYQTFAGCVWGFCFGNTQLLITPKISSCLFYGTVTWSQSSHEIGEFQREVPPRVYFSHNCRSTPVHLLVSLRHSSQAKLRNWHIQGLWKSQIPSFL